MKRTLLLSFVLLLSTAMFAQNRASLINEHFDGSTMPEGWSISGYGQSNWSVSPTNNAGGKANEMRLYWSPQFGGKSRLVTPAVDLTGIEGVVFTFKHCLDNYGGTHKLYIETSADSITWNSGWDKMYNNSATETINEVISTPDMGKDNVFFCITYEGSSYNLNDWYFDDIEVFTQEDTDLKLVSIDIPEIVNTGSHEIKFTVQNIGVQAVESFVVQSSEDYCGSTTVSFDAEIAPFETKQFTLATTPELTPGTYYLPIDIIEVNGNPDDDASNNTQMKSFNVAMSQTQRTPMIEHFSSSTCGPCVSVNFAMSQLTSTYAGQYTYTKYPVNWPGSGDPYYTTECKTRIDFNNVSAAPQLFLDGINQGFSHITPGNFSNRLNVPAFANVRGAFNVDGNTINIIADFMAYSDMENVAAFVSVNEETTTGNVGSNGEQEFHHIMMKMLENADGNLTTINAGEYQRFEFSYDMSSTNVEEMNDLEVSLWLQNLETKEIYNSHFAYAYTDHCYPVQNHQMTAGGGNLNVTWEAPEAGNPTGYNVYLNGELVLENTTEMSYTTADNGTVIVEVVAVYGDKTSVGTMSNNLDEEDAPCNAPSNLNAIVEQDVEGFDHEYKVTLSWDEVEEASAYIVNLDGELLGTLSDNQYVIGFDEEGEHYFTVASVCTNGTSEESEAFNFEVKPTSIDELGSSFNIYPNPAKDYMMISGKDIETISIYNYLGILIDRIETSSDNVEINTSGYNSGVYFINVMDKEGRSSTTKAIINK